MIPVEVVVDDGVEIVVVIKDPSEAIMFIELNPTAIVVVTTAICPVVGDEVEALKPKIVGLGLNPKSVGLFLGIVLIVVVIVVVVVAVVIVVLGLVVVVVVVVVVVAVVVVHFSIERLRGYFRLLRRISLLTNDILNQISRL